MSDCESDGAMRSVVMPIDNAFVAASHEHAHVPLLQAARNECRREIVGQTGARAHL
jgi:hypothetical protein